MNIHKNARLTPGRREEMARAVLEGAYSKADAARIYGGDVEGGRSLDGAFSGGWHRRHGGPVVAAEEKSETHRDQHCRRDCSVALTAADRQAHRQADGRVGGNDGAELRVVRGQPPESVTLTLTANFSRRQSTPAAIPR